MSEIEIIPISDYDGFGEAFESYCGEVNRRIVESMAVPEAAFDGSGPSPVRAACHAWGVARSIRDCFYETISRRSRAFEPFAGSPAERIVLDEWAAMLREREWSRYLVRRFRRKPGMILADAVIGVGRN